MFCGTEVSLLCLSSYTLLLERIKLTITTEKKIAKRRARPELDIEAPVLLPPLTYKPVETATTPAQAEDVDVDADDWTAIDAEDVAEAEAQALNKPSTTTTTMNKQRTNATERDASDVQLVRLYIKEINSGMRPDAVARKYHISVLNMVESIAKFAAQRDAEAMKAGT